MRTMTTDELTHPSIPLETASMVVKLNHLLADHVCFSLKMRIFHWNVSGSDFFELHEQFEQLYNLAEEQSDELAERISYLGGEPLNHWDKYESASLISISNHLERSFHMVKETLSDIHKINERVDEILNEEDHGLDPVTKFMLLDQQKALQKYEWFLRSFSKGV